MGIMNMMNSCLLFITRRLFCMKIKTLVPGDGLEPSHPKAGDFKSPVSTDSTTRATDVCICKSVGQIYLSKNERIKKY